MAITAVEALQLGQILGSLLGSVVEAQAESARATVEFVQNVGFETVGQAEQMRTVRLRYTKKDEDGNPAEFEVEVPLLALVNVPALIVRTAKITLGYEVVTASAIDAEPPIRALPIATRVPPATLTGFVRPSSSAAPGAARPTTAINLEVTLEQQEVPIGVERLFDLAELGISERPTDGAPT